VKRKPNASGVEQLVVDLVVAVDGTSKWSPLLTISSAPASSAISMRRSSVICVDPMRIWPLRAKLCDTAPVWAMLPPLSLKAWRTSAAARFLLSVVTSTMRPTPPGA